MKKSDYIIVAKNQKTGKIITDNCDGTDTPVTDFKEIYWHSGPWLILAIIDKKSNDIAKNF